MAQVYRVVESKSAAGLENQVNDFLRQGWEVRGNLVATQEAGQVWLLQAMTLTPIKIGKPVQFGPNDFKDEFGL